MLYPPRPPPCRRFDMTKKDESSAGRRVDVFSQVLESSSENLLADDSERLVELLVACGEQGADRIDIVVDNAGEWVRAMWMLMLDVMVRR